MKEKNGLAAPEAAEEQMAFDFSNGEIVSSSALQRVMDEATNAAEKAHDGKSLLLDPQKKVVMSNKFVVGLEDGTRFAYRISRIAISQIPMDADSLPTTVITADDVQAMGLTRQRLTGHANEVIDEILNYRIKLASIDEISGKRKLTGINMFSQASVIPGKGAIVVQLNPVLKDHFLQLQADFTQYALPVALRLPGYASAKLHELLLSRSRAYGASLLRFKISDLAAILNYDARADYKPSTFVNNVIKRAVESINEHSESYVRYKAIRVGRSYEDIRFYIESSYGTLEEKQRVEQWSAGKRSGVYGALDQAAEEEIGRLLETGEGEIRLDSHDDYGTYRKRLSGGVK